MYLLINKKVNTMFTLLTNFKTNTKGNVATILAICLSPLIGFVGFAIDYNEASRQRAMLQSASDMAALYIAKLDDADKKSKAQTIATDIVTNIVEGNKILNLVIEGSIEGKTVSVSATANNPNSFSRIFGFDNTKVGVIAQAKYSMPDVEISLVLDTTGSMKDNDKIGELKEATINLINRIKTLNENSDNHKTRVSLISFADRIKTSISLSNDWDMLTNTVQSFDAWGYTAIGYGMQEAGKLLVNGDKKIKNYMIVMSDGEENARLDVGMPITCPKIRAEGTELYMVGMQGADASAMTACAGSTNRFFDASRKGDLETSFQRIFDEIASLRLTK
jgi:Flp pilus assembly protein TadG